MLKRLTNVVVVVLALSGIVGFNVDGRVGDRVSIGFLFFIYIGPDASNSVLFYQRDGHPAPSEFAPAGLFLAGQNARTGNHYRSCRVLIGPSR
jgi:hypothetical protein